MAEPSSEIHFVLEKTGSLISSVPDMPGPGPYYTTLVDMDAVEDFPFDYALYFSTDHDREEGGIWLYVCSGSPTEAENWQSYDGAVAAGAFDHIDDKPESNPIFVDAVQGNGHTETPHANVIDGTVYMTYHKNGLKYSQATLLATSEDGVNFSRINGDDDSVILEYNPGEDVGNGHTGYFRWGINPFAGIDQKYVGYSLHGGGDNYHSAIWASDDAVNWQKLDVLDPIEGLTVEADRILIWHEIDPASITRLDNGEYIAICGVGTRASGGVARITELYEIFLSEDGRTLKRKSRRILGRGGSESKDAEELASPTSIVVDDTYHLIYVGACEEGTVNTVMGAFGKLDRTVPMSAGLKRSDQTRHINRA